MIFDIGNLQGPGARDYQQDAFAISDACEAACALHGLNLILADGMGGISDGGAIAQATVEYLRAVLLGEHNEGYAYNEGYEHNEGYAYNENAWNAIRSINTRIYESYHESGGTTLIVARIAPEGLSFASVGDSNLYLLRSGQLVELNRRHEFALDLLEQALAGSLTPEAALADPQAKALSSFIGCHELAIDATRAPLPLQDGDVLMLCSDGVSDTLTLEQLRQTLREVVSGGAQAACERLEQLIVQAALPNQDNYTAIVVRYEADERDSCPAGRIRRASTGISTDVPVSAPGSTTISTTGTTYNGNPDRITTDNSSKKEEARNETEEGIPADPGPGDRAGGARRRRFGLWHRSDTER